MRFVVGDIVRVTTTDPECGWGKVRHGDIGAITSTDVGFRKLVSVDFLRQKSWYGLQSEFELVSASEGGPNREHKNPTREW